MWAYSTRPVCNTTLTNTRKLKIYDDSFTLSFPTPSLYFLISTIRVYRYTQKQLIFEDHSITNHDIKKKAFMKATETHQKFGSRDTGAEPSRRNLHYDEKSTWTSKTSFEAVSYSRYVQSTLFMISRVV